MFGKERKRRIVSIVAASALIASSLMMTSCGKSVDNGKVVDDVTLPIFENATFENHDALNALFEGNATYTNEQTGIGKDMNMHFADFIKVKDEIWAYYIKWEDGAHCGVALAVSKDGINFEDKGFVLEPTEDEWDNTMSSFPGVWYDNGTFYLVYEGSGSAYIKNDETMPEHRGSIGWATSEDGINFKKQGILLDCTNEGIEACNIGTPDIFKKDNMWYVTYHTFDYEDCQICYAYGEDLHNLTKSDKNPIIPCGEKDVAPDSGTTGRRDIMYYDGYFYMAYEISTEQPYNTADWCHKFARSKDMENWEIADSIYPHTESNFGNDGPSWLVLDNKLYVYFRVDGNMTNRYELTLK